MKPIELQFQLPADIETSWKWLTEESLQKKWMTGLVSLQRTDGGYVYESGSRWHMVMQEGKKQKDYFATMSDVNHPAQFKLAIEATDLAPGGKILVNYKLTPNGNATHLEYIATLTADHFPLFLRLTSPLIIMMIKRNTQKMFQSMISQMQES